MYYPQPQNEPSGCLQTLVITRVILGILLVPILMIVGALFAVVFTFYLFTVSAPLALIPIALGAAGLLALYRWEKARIDRETPPPD